MPAALAMEALKFIEHRLCDIEPFSPPSNKAGELKDESERKVMLACWQERSRRRRR